MRLKDLPSTQEADHRPVYVRHSLVGSSRSLPHGRDPLVHRVVFCYIKSVCDTSWSSWFQHLE